MKTKIVNKKLAEKSMKFALIFFDLPKQLLMVTPLFHGEAASSMVSYLRCQKINFTGHSERNRAIFFSSMTCAIVYFLINITFASLWRTGITRLLLDNSVCGVTFL